MSLPAIVAQVAANAGIELPKAAPSNPFDQWVDDPLIELPPGFHWDGEHAWFVTHGMRKVKKQVGRGKNAVEIDDEQPHLMALRDDRVAAWYDREGLLPFHLRPNPKATHRVLAPRWRVTSARAYYEGRAKARPTKDLFDELRTVFLTYVEYEELIHYDLLPLFILQSYVYPLWNATGYLHFNGTMQSGKSRNLSLINLLSLNSRIASNISPSALFRTSEGLRGVICVDEAEKLDEDQQQDLRQLLLGGYTSDGTTIRSERVDDNWEPYEFSSFVPKAIASISELDEVLSSRSIVIPMVPALKAPAELDTSDPSWLDLRDELHIWALSNAATIAAATRLWNRNLRFTQAPALVNRSWQISQSYVTLAYLIDEADLLPRIIAFFTEYAARQAKTLDSTDHARLTLRALPRVLATRYPRDDGRYKLSDIYHVISMYLDPDTLDWFKSAEVRRYLEVLGFKDKTVKSGGLGYRLDQETVRKTLRNRMVEPFDEDIHWLESGDDHRGPGADQDPTEDEQEELAWGA